MSAGSSFNPQSGRVGAQPRFGRLDLGLDRVSDGIRRATDWLLGEQHPDGYWCGELEADSMLESDYIFMHTLLGTGDRGKMERADERDSAPPERRRRMEPNYPGGPSNINYGVKCVSGAEADGLGVRSIQLMVKARENRCFRLGGVVECNTFTKIYLCSLGQYDYDAVPAVPPELVLFPELVLLQYL